MKVLLINNFFCKKGGAETVFLNTIELLRSKGHDVVTLSLDENIETVEDNGHYFVKRKSIYHNQFYSFEAKRKISEIIGKEKPDLAHIHNIIGRITFSILPVLKKNNIPVVATIHDFRLLCPTYSFVNSANEICEKCINGSFYNCALHNCSQKGRIHSTILAIESYWRNIFIPFNKYIDEFIFVSDFYKDKFLNVFPELLTKSHRIYNFADKFECTKGRGNYFFFLGRLSKIKGLFTLIKAFAGTENQNLKIAGEGELKTQIKEIKTSNIELLGFKNKENIQELIKNCSFVIVPSEWYENNPMAIIESYALSKPVIGSEIGGIKELIENENTGLLFNPYESEHLKQISINAVNLADKKYYEMCINAYNFAQTNFAPDVHYNQLINVYSNLVQNKRKNCV